MLSSDPSPAAVAHALQSPLLQGLNDEQLAAVTLPAEHALILAGAGSGKTRVLTTRIAWLLQTRQASAGQFDGGDLHQQGRQRNADPLGRHAARQCARHVDWHFSRLVQPFFAGALEAGQLAASLSNFGHPRPTLCGQATGQAACNIDDERFPPKQLQWFIAGCKEDGQRPKDVQVRDPETRQKVEIYQLYEDQCQREGVVDFGELMLRSYELLRDNDALARALPTALHAYLD